MKPYPPLGILYICAHLRRKGVQAQVFDSTFSSRQELFKVIRTGPPSVIGVYANLMTRANVVEILRCAKEAGWQTIVGGPEPGAYIDEYLNAEQILSSSEKERSLSRNCFPSCMENLSNLWKRSQELLSGLGAAKLFRRVHANRFVTVSAQPWPAREAIDMDRYVSSVARPPWHGIGITDHGARLSVPLPVVQPSGIWQNPSPPKPSLGSRGTRLACREISPRHGVDGGRRLHHPSWLALPIRGGVEAAWSKSSF